MSDASLVGVSRVLTRMIEAHRFIYHRSDIMAFFHLRPCWRSLVSTSRYMLLSTMRIPFIFSRRLHSANLFSNFLIHLRIASHLPNSPRHGQCGRVLRSVVNTSSTSMGGGWYLSAKHDGGHLGLEVLHHVVSCSRWTLRFTNALALKSIC